MTIVIVALGKPNTTFICFKGVNQVDNSFIFRPKENCTFHKKYFSKPYHPYSLSRYNLLPLFMEF